MGLLAALLVLSIGYVLYVGFKIEPSDVQIVTHYTAFGPTNFYRTRWVYLLTFIAFGLLFAAAHSILALKLLAEKDRSFAIGFLCLSLGMLGITFALTASILNIAAL